MAAAHKQMHTNGTKEKAQKIDPNTYGNVKYKSNNSNRKVRGWTIHKMMLEFWGNQKEKNKVKTIPHTM